MKKITAFLLALSVLATFLVACGPNFHEGDTVVALEGADSLYRNLTAFDWQFSAKQCVPKMGDIFTVEEITTYGIGEYVQGTMMLQSKSDENCWGWTTPGDDDWGQ